jgi:hypothetical protein
MEKYCEWCGGKVSKGIIIHTDQESVFTYYTFQILIKQSQLCYLTPKEFELKAA